jgi:Protein of unknown function (DUF2939)
MKRLLFKATLLMLAIAAYIAAPFATAWSIREAVRNGDAAYLENKIDWPAVRVTLAPTIGKLILDAPDPEQVPVTNPGLWQRFKVYMGQGAVNRAVESYVTPEGLTKLFNYRKLYRDYVSGQPDESKLSVTDRMKRMWARVKRAEFTSLTTFEIDMADKHDPDRVYLAKLALEGINWKVKELRIRTLTTANNAPAKFMDTPSAPAAVPQVAPEAAAPPTKSSRWSTGFISRAEAAPLTAPKTNFWARAKSAAR